MESSTPEHAGSRCSEQAYMKEVSFLQRKLYNIYNMDPFCLILSYLYTQTFHFPSIIDDCSVEAAKPMNISLLIFSLGKALVVVSFNAKIKPILSSKYGHQPSRHCKKDNCFAKVMSMNSWPYERYFVLWNNATCSSLSVVWWKLEPLEASDCKRSQFLARAIIQCVKSVLTLPVFAR